MLSRWLSDAGVNAMRSSVENNGCFFELSATPMTRGRTNWRRVPQVHMPFVDGVKCTGIDNRVFMHSKHSLLVK